ncbi:alpha/beta fold hydrolase [Raineya orbicola]|jgi:pimeloyl-ACP methyl ester carboxylesterase|uniref:Alpha/beta hydrolase family n=1 Tax=Raineya orbicola TaxID=2016530 RepID=A0A2N3IJM4_9BACT|nr:alpha/beta hydrolase [Raineya orbicola]PKQ70532.1 Alpha/beta hydrolase family [Raineya orbicola]
MELNIKKEGDFTYIDEGQGEILLLLHGLFGALSNWKDVVAEFSKDYRVVIPMMPIYDLPLTSTGIEGLTDFIEKFVNQKKLTDLTLLGNSLGGHIALTYTLRKQANVKRLVLTGSSGLFENTMGGSYPKRGSYEYIKDRVEYTFYDPKTATEELVLEVFEITKSIPKCMKIVAIAKSAQRHNMAKDIPNIYVPTLLVWGLNDTITPPLVAYEFDALMPNTELRFIDKCGHAPMMEHPDKFNKILRNFLQRNPIASKQVA